MTFSWTISPKVSLYSLFLPLGFQNRRVLRFQGRRRRSRATGRAGVTSERNLTTRCRPRARRDGSERRRPFTHLFPPSSDTLLPNCVVLPPNTPCLARFCTSRPQRTAYPPAGHRTRGASARVPPEARLHALAHSAMRLGARGEGRRGPDTRVATSRADRSPSPTTRGGPEEPSAQRKSGLGSRPGARRGTCTELRRLQRGHC